MKLLASDLADNSGESKVLKLQDLDIWTREELVDFINKHHMVW